MNLKDWLAMTPDEKRTIQSQPNGFEAVWNVVEEARELIESQCLHSPEILSVDSGWNSKTREGVIMIHFDSAIDVAREVPVLRDAFRIEYIEMGKLRDTYLNWYRLVLKHIADITAETEEHWPRMKKAAKRLRHTYRSPSWYPTSIILKRLCTVPAGNVAYQTAFYNITTILEKARENDSPDWSEVRTSITRELTVHFPDSP